MFRITDVSSQFVLGEGGIKIKIKLAGMKKKYANCLPSQFIYVQTQLLRPIHKPRSMFLVKQMSAFC